MSSVLPKELVLGAKLIEIRHSRFTEPKFIVEGIGPASFRSHFLCLDSGVILDHFTAEIGLAKLPEETMPGETAGLPIREILGRSITSIVRDDCRSSLVLLDQGFYLKDDNDGIYGNPLRAGKLQEDYSAEELAKFLDYWTEKPVDPLRG